MYILATIVLLLCCTSLVVGDAYGEGGILGLHQTRSRGINLGGFHGTTGTIHGGSGSGGTINNIHGSYRISPRLGSQSIISRGGIGSFGTQNQRIITDDGSRSYGGSDLGRGRVISGGSGFRGRGSLHSGFVTSFRGRQGIHDGLRTTGSFGGGRIGIRSGSRTLGFGVGSVGGAININNFANIDGSSFGLTNFAPQYVNILSFDFNRARADAFADAPRGSINTEARQQIIGRRFASGSAAQTQTSASERSGSGNGVAGIELTASRSASQDAQQQFTQQAVADGATELGNAYGFSANNRGQIRYNPVQVESLPVHAAPRSSLPATVRVQGGITRGSRISDGTGAGYAGRGYYTRDSF